MTAQNNGNNGGFWVVLAIVFGIAMLGQLVGGGGSTSSNSSSTTPPASSGSFEHRYVQERFKQEGYNAAESRQAADAVMRFHEAQQQRKNR
jgi:hypothetical protein